MARMTAHASIVNTPRSFMQVTFLSPERSVTNVFVMISIPRAFASFKNRCAYSGPVMLS